MQRAFPTQRLVPVRPAGRRDRARLRAGRPVRLRRQPPRPLAADAVRRLPRPQPDRLPAEEPDRVERQPPVPARPACRCCGWPRTSARAAAAGAWCRCWPSAMAVQVGPTVRNAYSAWNSAAGEPSYWQPGRPVPGPAPGRGLPGRGRLHLGPLGRLLPGPASLPLARGWYRQDDFPQNTVLYDDAQLNAADVPGVAAPARRALRAAARHGARLQLAGRGASCCARAAPGLRAGRPTPATGASTSCRRRRRSSAAPPTSRRS